MKPYKNLGKDSGVAFYEIENNSITVQFTTGATYLYNYQSAGQQHIEQMKILAIAGRGLNSYIKKHANKGYAKKLR
ncbi:MULTISPECIES: hypothetical protein [unclassified Pseudomonas]|uniref:hypothetical protein n=1 Tax=unclassified Pseudomonas TaxID=196821 RepID=UPI000DAA6AC5|nr:MULTISPECIES: hypothetical protein [unclassified Pseudomonas]MDW3711708.1 hypothetical protein [Pseudomonas sp. 2023EL-01195]PZE09446.1 hypothetical protein DMX10_31050 [Pseudomonas sp. 57B-090624]